MLASRGLCTVIPQHPASEPRQSHSRRQFVQTAATAIAAGMLGRSTADLHITPSERITIGVIGLGSRGFNLLDDFLAIPECQIVAVCDVAELHYRDLESGKGKAYGRQPAVRRIAAAYGSSGSANSATHVFSDYRELIAMENVDAVVVATPDHWHALCTFEAIKHGKDVYCEKPVTHLFAEGQSIVAKAAECGTVFQTGSQQRSNPVFQKVVELARNGVLGDIKSVEVGLPPGYEKVMGSTQIATPPSDLDYNFWCGPSPVLPLMQARHHRWWRGHRAFGGGVLMDWIGHHNDIAQWALGMERSGPIRVEATNWTFPETDVYNTPHQYTIECKYSNGVSSTISSRNKQGVKVIGTDGWVYARRGFIEASDSRWLADDFHAGNFQVARGVSHAADFLVNVRSRGECIAPAEIGHRSITPGHLGYVSHTLQQPLTWDPVLERVAENEAANKLLSTLTYRAPWTLPMHKATS